ncbi:MAG: FAD-dependent oxidoreductase [Pseudomonadota bacterium]
MPNKSVVIIGAGQCGLCMSHALSSRAIDHVVIERGDIGQNWRSDRWDSLRMLTPNWANMLPGMNHPDPHGYMTPCEFTAQLECFANQSGGEIQKNTTVQRIARKGAGFVTESDRGVWESQAVVLATGAASRPILPKLAQAIPAHIKQITPDQYRGPTDVPSGHVLVVGASATGVQLARELQLAGRQVILSTGSHVRLPRRYRGKDIEHWLHVTGVLDQPTGEIINLLRAMQLPSPQLMGGSHDVDLNALQALGVSVVGRLAAIRDGIALFSGGLNHLAASADLKMHRLFDLADQWIAENGIDVPEPNRPANTTLPSNPTLSLRLDSEDVQSVIWATGFAPDFSMLDIPAFDARGRLKHYGGVCDIPGLYVLGLPFLRRRRSHHISGAAADAEDLAAHLSGRLNDRTAA